MKHCAVEVYLKKAIFIIAATSVCLGVNAEDEPVEGNKDADSGKALAIVENADDRKCAAVVEKFHRELKRCVHAALASDSGVAAAVVYEEGTMHRKGCETYKRSKPGVRKEELQRLVEDLTRSPGVRAAVVRDAVRHSNRRLLWCVTLRRNHYKTCSGWSGSPLFSYCESHVVMLGKHAEGHAKYTT
ncbi:hypothetical protein HPB50_013026 [Hyalomma asiaticum]|uniref:Uncharacterized protein n=1 Tax=Hyalomma asiaticum TaxID=266040 RepID=A0ACB7RRX0_HYAAI|nr:hypothetical protein HPB50_013026 [Hyalomma asiaticum]